MTATTDAAELLAADRYDDMDPDVTEQPIALPTRDGDNLWDIVSVAAYCGITPRSVNNYLYGAGSKSHPFPKPEEDPTALLDISREVMPGIATLLSRAGGTHPMRLWRASAIRSWQDSRPRAGVGGQPAKHDD